MAPKSGVSRRLRTGQAEAARATLSWADESLFRDQESIRVTLDAIVLANGILLGPDRQGTGAKLNAWAAADKDTIGALRSLQGKDLRAAISALANAPEFSGPAGVSDHYQEQRQRTSASLLALLDNQGEEALRRTLSAMSSAARIPTIRR